MSDLIKPKESSHLKPQEANVDFKMSDLVPIAESFADGYLENQRQANETQLEVAKMQLEAQKHRDEMTKQIRHGVQAFERHKFNLQFWFLVFIAVAVFGFAAGLIFVLREVNTGILILTHIGAIVSGLLAGIGWESNRQRTTGSKTSQ